MGVMEALRVLEGEASIDTAEANINSLYAKLRGNLDEAITVRTLENELNGMSFDLEPEAVAGQIFGDTNQQRIDNPHSSKEMIHVHRNPTAIDAYAALAQGDFLTVSKAMKALGVAGGRQIPNPAMLEQMRKKQEATFGLASFRYYEDAGVDFGDGKSADEVRGAMDEEIRSSADDFGTPRKLLPYELVHVTGMSTSIPGFTVDYMAQTPRRNGPRESETPQYVVLLHPNGETRAKIALSKQAPAQKPAAEQS